MILSLPAIKAVKLARACVATLALGGSVLAHAVTENVAPQPGEPGRAARTQVPNPPPTDVAAQALSPTAMRVTWANSTGSRASVARSTAGGPEVFAGYGSWGVFEDNGLLPGVSYTYRVSSIVDYPEGSSYSDPSQPASQATSALATLDIGNVGAPGSVSRNGQVLSVTGSGADIWDNTDEFHFAHTPWSGDAVLVVRVLDVERTDFWAKGGLMIRESLAGGSRYAMAFANPNGDGYLQTRAAAGAATTIAGANLTYTPSWLKLTRAGSVFRAYQSRDGSAWAEIGSATLDLPANVYVGLAVTSHRRGTPATARFDNLSLSPAWNPAGPGVPANVTGAATAWNKVRIDWTDTASGEAGFIVEKSSDNINFAWAGGAGPNATTATVEGLAPSTTYHFRVRSTAAPPQYLSAGSSSVVTVTTLAPPADAPPAPAGVVATVVSAYRIDVSWTDNSATEARFVLERSLDGASFFQHAILAANATAFSDTQLIPSTTYHYRVRAELADGYSSAPSASATATTQPPPAAANPPGGATAAALSPYSIRVSWIDNSTDETEFFVESSTDGINFSHKTSAPANATSVDVPFLEPSTQYYFRVKSVVGSVTSAPSNSASATTQPRTAAPDGVTATAVSGTRVDLRWNDSNPNTTHYQVWRAVGDGGTATSHVETIPATSRTYSDLTVNPATTYRYVIRALEDVFPSEYSNPVLVTTPAEGPTGWEARDVGAVSAPGSSSESGGTLTVHASGNDIWGNQDEFYYRYRRWTGDGTFVARVTGMSNADTWAKAGIMLRESAETGARHVFVMANGISAGGVVWRGAANGASSFAGAAYEIPQIWLKLVRTGQTFQAYQSANGVDWRALGPALTVALPETVLAGIAVTSHADGAICTATFTDIAFSGGSTPPPTAPVAPSGLSASAGASAVALAWTDNSSGETAFVLERSTDGANFSTLATLAANATSHSDFTAAAATTYHYRIKAMAGSASSAYSNTATLTTPSTPTPGTWQFGDIGAVGVAGSNSASGNTITVSASGSDIWDGADAFRFVYRSLTGDGTVEARVTSLGYTHGWAKAGVMIRESLAPNARNAFAFVTPVHHGIVAQSRDATGGPTTHQPGPSANAPYWVRLTRSGNTFTAAASPDGTSWTTFATYTIPMGATAYFGFALTSHDNSQLTTATFADPSVH